MVHNVSFPLKASVSKSCEEIQKHSDHKQKRRRLEDIDQQIQCSLESKAAANQIASADMLELEKEIEKVQRIAKERNSIEKELKFKERECQLLSELKELKDEFFQRKIAKKKKKIAKLKAELQSKECELKSAQQEARLQQDKLLKAQAELRKMHKEVKQLQREREELAQAYDIENLEVSKHIQITVVATSSEEEMKVTAWVVVIHYPYFHSCMGNDQPTIKTCHACMHIATV